MFTHKRAKIIDHLSVVEWVSTHRLANIFDHLSIVGGGFTHKQAKIFDNLSLMGWNQTPTDSFPGLNNVRSPCTSAELKLQPTHIVHPRVSKLAEGKEISAA